MEGLQSSKLISQWTPVGDRKKIHILSSLLHFFYHHILVPGSCRQYVCTLCSSGTGALVRVDEINARASILARLRLAFIDFFGAVHSMVTRDTLMEEEEETSLFLLLFLTPVFKD